MRPPRHRDLSAEQKRKERRGIGDNRFSFAFVSDPSCRHERGRPPRHVDAPTIQQKWDLTIREKFNTYRFADYKEKVIDLLLRVTTVSIETMKIINAMRSASR